MKYIFFLFVLFASFQNIKAQHYDIGIQVGAFTPLDFWYYVDGQIGPQAGLTFKYHFNNKLAISSNYLRGQFGYSPALAELRFNGQKFGAEQATVSVDIFNFMFHRKFPLKNNWDFSIGTGIGYYLENRNMNSINPDRSFRYTRDFTMPWNINLSKEILPNVILGLYSGVFLTPFYTFGGFHLGPSVSYRL